MKRLGLDVGTKNIVLAYREGDQVKHRREVNGFYKIALDNAFAKNMLKQLGVSFVESDNGKELIALGERAERIAVTFGGFLRRPMERGTLSVSEKEAMRIMAVILRSIIGDLEEDSILYYCVPANAINETTNVGYHQKIIQAILDGYESKSGGKLQCFPINEARALVFSEFEAKTGLGISLGAGMVNVSYCLLGLPVYEFSIVGSGDWVDIEAARQTGNLEKVEGVERPRALVAEAKESIDLSKGMPTDGLGRAIYIHYQMLIERVTSAIIRGFNENESKAKAPMPMPVVLAGGTSSPNGFVEMFKESFKVSDMPFEIGEVTRADKPLYAVSTGCLDAAELS